MCRNQIQAWSEAISSMPFGYVDRREIIVGIIIYPSRRKAKDKALTKTDWVRWDVICQ